MDSTLSHASSRSKRSSSSSQESIIRIPSPAPERPRYEFIGIQLWFALALAVVMIVLSIGLEVALAISKRDGGFAVPKKNVFKFASPQFLASFFPTILLLPLPLLWNYLDWILRWYQPYVTLSTKKATASEGLLLDYNSLDKVTGSWIAYRRKHWIMLVSGITALAAYGLQPLAGAVLSIRQLPQINPVTVQAINTVGLSPEVPSLNAFVAAAGFAEAAVFHGLPDPPFIRGGWATNEFTLPQEEVLNGTVTVQTQGIQTASNCENSAEQALQRPATGSNNFLISARSRANCTVRVSFVPATADQQYGVVAVPNCGTATTNVTLQPAMFWFYGLNSDGNSRLRTVFCTPTIAPFTVNATVSMNNNTLTQVKIVSDYTEANTVTGPPLNGKAFNGVVFDNSTNPFIQARATATNAGVPGAIFRFAAQKAGGADPVFEDLNGFLNITRLVYTQHLSIVAKSIYFVPTQEPLQAALTSLVPRLVVDETSGHGLAVILFLIGTSGIVFHVLHWRARRRLHLTSPPSTIGAIVSLTAHSGFGALLLPYDTERDMKRKLQGLRFSLDRRTGAIVAHEIDEDGEGGKEWPGKVDASSQMSLLSERGTAVRSPPLFNPYENYPWKEVDHR